MNLLSPPHWGGSKGGVFTVTTREWKKYRAKNVILSSGGKSFAQVGTTGEWYNIAEKLWLKMVVPYRTLSWMATKTDVSEVSGVSCVVDMELRDKPLRWNAESPQPPLLKGEKEKKSIYKEKWPILFTHFGVSGPIIHNVSNAIGEYLNQKIKTSPPTPLLQERGDIDYFFEKYICDNLILELTFDLENTPKRLIKFFDLCPPPARGELEGGNTTRTIPLENWRSWKEAKATGGWISTDELDNHMQSKKYLWLYIIGEVVDVTGKTGGFNLQWAWSSSYVATEHINLT